MSSLRRWGLLCDKNVQPGQCLAQVDSELNSVSTRSFLNSDGDPVFWLGYQNWCGHLGASLDRDSASPGLLGVRWDGPAGGGTWGVRPAERRLPNGPAADVCSGGPVFGQNDPGGCKVWFRRIWAGPGWPRPAGGSAAFTPFFFSIYEED